MNSRELAEETGRNLRWIQKIAGDLAKEGLCSKVGGMYVFDRGAVKYVNENFGRKS